MFPADSAAQRSISATSSGVIGRSAGFTSTSLSPAVRVNDELPTRAISLIRRSPLCSTRWYADPHISFAPAAGLMAPLDDSLHRHTGERPGRLALREGRLTPSSSSARRNRSAESRTSAGSCPARTRSGDCPPWSTLAGTPGQRPNPVTDGCDEFRGTSAWAFGAAAEQSRGGVRHVFHGNGGALQPSGSAGVRVRSASRTALGPRTSGRAATPPRVRRTSAICPIDETGSYAAGRVRRRSNTKHRP